ncbi:MAG: hypothetical protein M3O70_13630 [Actinomycetota bacterium]|nr:hypothetical protein [Actinomycetota bacterium]
MSTSDDQLSWATRLHWSLRNYAWLVVACVLGFAAIPLAVPAPSPIYEAQALVIARTLEVDPSALPKFAQAVFTSGAVARAVAADPAIGGSPRELIPERLDIVAAEDSIVFPVLGRDDVPTTAARLANLAAAAFVEELNKGGAGIGSFAVHSAARVPSQALDPPDRSLPASVGAIAGGVLGLGLIALIAVLRYPVVDTAGVRSALGTRLLGTVLLHRPVGGRLPAPQDVPGIAAVTRWLADAPPGRILFASSRRLAPARRYILAILAVALSPLRPTSVLSAQPRDAIQARSEGDPGAEPAAEPRDGSRGPMVLVDGVEMLDTLDQMLTLASVVLVVRMGVPRATLRAMASGYRPEELFGVIIVDTRPIRRGMFTNGHGVFAPTDEERSEVPSQATKRYGEVRA